MRLGIEFLLLKCKEETAGISFSLTSSYLASAGALATGATTCYIPEKGINIKLLGKDIDHLRQRYQYEIDHGIPREGRLVLRTENASPVYTTNVVNSILKAEGKGLFDSRTAVFGHLQQGGVPSPSDRIRATRLAVSCIDWIEGVAAEQCGDGRSAGCVGKVGVWTDKREHACVIGIKGAAIEFSPVEELVGVADMKKRRQKREWWWGMLGLVEIFSKYQD
jgi:hypothetical protein